MQLKVATVWDCQGVEVEIPNTLRSSMAEFIGETNYPSETNYPYEKGNFSRYKSGGTKFGLCLIRLVSTSIRRANGRITRPRRIIRLSILY